MVAGAAEGEAALDASVMLAATVKPHGISKVWDEVMSHWAHELRHDPQRFHQTLMPIKVVLKRGGGN